jgi:outer membrane protein OmpA-like peptidoglycan-associated protein
MATKAALFYTWAMRTLRALVLACSLGALLPTAARANDINLVVSPKVPVGQKVTLTVNVAKDLKSCTVDVKSTGGGRVRQTLGPKEAGGSLVFNLPQDKPGRVTWSGSLSVVFDDGTEGSMPLTFQTEVLSSFKFQVKEIDADKHTAVYVSEHDTAQIDLEVYGDNGEQISTTSQAFDGAKAGTALSVKWTPLADGPVLRVHAVLHDTSGATQSVDSFPYNIAIPHEEVEFETGKADIRPSEEPKLTAALVELDKAVKRYTAAIKVEGATIRLFVAGHTDTVGPSSSNRALSDRRAQAIAQWFKKKGVAVPIYARGFGEDILRVDTPDETDEQKNRRVDYDVGVNGPTGSIAGWTRVN